VLTPPCPPNHTSAILVSWLSGLQSTLFNAIVENGKAAAANFPFCTIEPNVGMVTVPDARLQQLSDVSKSRETVSQEEGAGHVVAAQSGFVPKTITRACS
jgi:ribosome-binding ATPase YchF (GTP1/OBG family)